MEPLSRHPASGQESDGSLRLYRVFMAGAGVAYLVWWKAVEILLPGSFNPIGSRMAVVLFCWALFAGSFASPWASRHIAKLSHACLWLITIHYFYLFHNNQTDINWVVGAYITVIAACACLQTEAALLGYAAWVVFLSVALCSLDPFLLRTIFLPGTLTILAFAYLGLRSRLKLLRRSRETSRKFQDLFGAVFEGIVVHDGGVIVDANDSFAAIFGYGKSEVIGMRVMEFVAPESRSAVSGRISVMSEAPYETVGRRKDGSPVPIEIRGKKHEARGKELRIAAVSDITARKKNEQGRVLYEASQEAIRMRDEFLSIASHELKTPLTTIKLQTQMILRILGKEGPGALTPERVRTLVGQTDRQADRLARLVEEMLDVSRIAAGRLEIAPEEFELLDAVREAAAVSEAALRQSGSSLRIEGPVSFRIHADRFRVEQVISNLLSNAIKYGEGKPILMRLEAGPAEARLIFEDHGLGIPKEKQERIFHRFERATSFENISGLGIGLYISQHIVQAHGGRIEVESSPRQGARFTVRLPSEPKAGLA